MTTTLPERSNATIAYPEDPILTPADDPTLRAWERGRRTLASKAILDVAQEKLSRLLNLPRGWDGHRGSPTEPLAAFVLNGILESLVLDDGATPQIAPLPDGGVQVEWLVAQNSLEATVSPGGNVFLSASDDAGADVFDGEFPYWDPDQALLNEARMFLREISQQAGVRRLAS